MPVNFRRLRISGFKSFAEPASVEILPGLTGIVGPNGCGKSNVVEALRWAMGESSARTLRGGEMEDVIFAGSAGRASRDIAEVALFLDEAEGRAPPPFHEQAELEVVRRIERGSGSAYRVNGRDVRARDVQTLFADLASGARASAMVSQGRVGAVVAAKPEDRRVVLEEAANITGLHARRHEAELKLRAAEANLTRSEDARTQFGSQLATLQRQARQASRYRNICAALRALETDLLALQRARVEQARAQAAAALQAATLAVAAMTEAAVVAATRSTKAAAELPPLRAHEADARTVVERHRVSQEWVAEEEQRARAELAEARRRLEQLRQDLAHAQQLQRDAAAATQRLAAEHAALDRDGTGHEVKAAAAQAAALTATEAVRFAEAEANRATEEAAAAHARAQAAAQLLAQVDQQSRRLGERFQTLTGDRARIAARQVDPAQVAGADEAAAQAGAILAASHKAVQRAEQVRAATAAALAAARDAQATADSVHACLAAEAQALADILAVKDGESWPPMIDSLAVADGLEAALGAVLGEELTSALNPGAARHWEELPLLDPAPSLPACATPLSAFVRGPAALARSLSQIGMVEDEQHGIEHQTTLLPGQSLVSRSGAVWRWDGYTIRAGTPTQTAVRLQQRAQLSRLRAKRAVAERDAATARTVRAAAEAAAQTAANAEQQARTSRQNHEQSLDRARTSLAALRNQAASAAVQLAAADDQLALVTVECDEALAALEQARAADAALPDTAALRDAMNTARATLSAARSSETTALAERDALHRDHAARVRRRCAIDAERAGWIERARDAAERVADLAARLAEAEATANALEARPAEVSVQRVKALETLKAAEAAYWHAAETLSAAVARASETDQAARAAEAAVAARREDALRAEGSFQQSADAWAAVTERIQGRLGDNPVLPEPPDDLSRENEDRVRKRLERMAKEREEMGPVNLRAEQEAEALGQQVAALEAERQELATAIAKLRGSVGHLNREGRERLAAVFQQVDRNFQLLFTRMFGGGRAHLALVGSDDPLEAGLEIYAQPPGKKLAALSLLSGGEQALTALSLVFAVFRCNPAPVCVLDEVDAPLDDANVERFCTLLEDMVRDTATRFLIVTHHPLTMARMDRLYGVTMQERGVSRLLSVDLAAAAEMIDQPLLAAE